MLEILKHGPALVVDQHLLLGEYAKRVVRAVGKFEKWATNSEFNLRLQLYLRQHVTQMYEAGICFDPYQERPATAHFQVQVLRFFSPDKKCYGIARAHFEHLVEKNGFRYYVP